MKNKKITSLLEIVSVDIRISVYKKAIKLIEKQIIFASVEGYGLCLLLPCILWDLKHYCDLAPNGKDWEYRDTIIAFPELTEEMIVELLDVEATIRNIKRVELLKQFIIDLK
jgi:hypothetical protein